MRIGVGLSLSQPQRAAGAAVFNIATLPLTFWLERDFTASPWTSTASAGVSGGRSASSALLAPTPGAVLGGKHSAHYDGLTNLLTIAGGLKESDLFTDVAGGVMVLIRADAGLGASGGGASFDAGPFSGTGGYIALGVYSGACSFLLYTATVPKKINIAATHDGATWHAMFMRWDGAVLEAGVDAGVLTSVACTGMGDLTSPVQIGNNLPGGSPFPGEIRECLTWATTPSDADRANVLSAWRTNYGIPLA